MPAEENVSSRLLIPLNICRKEKLYIPWECNDERHSYEKSVFIRFISFYLLSVNWVILDANMKSELNSAVGGILVSTSSLATCGV